MGKKRIIWRFIVSMVICMYLFSVKWTTVVPHAIVGIIFIGAMLVHMGRRLKRMKYVEQSKRMVDYILTLDCVVLLFTGLIAHPMHDVILVTILHAVTAILFVILCTIHVVQHVKKRVNSVQDKEIKL